MTPTFPTALVNETLLNEIARSAVSLEPVLFFYGGLIAAAAVLWMIGVVAFGRPRTAKAAGEPMAASRHQRTTPVVP